MSNAPDYPDHMRRALKEMHRQVGDLQVVGGVARRGLLVRHLVMPGAVAGSSEVLRFIAREVSPYTWVNVMGQYRPLYRAHRHPDIARPITSQEWREALAYAHALGLNTF
jgi:putative pyruvate formate lyase activating enzyme